MNINAFKYRRDILRVPSDLMNTSLTLPPLPTFLSDICFLDEVPSAVDIQNGCALPLSVSDIYFRNVTRACALTSGEDVKKVLSLCLEVKDCEKLYVPGDCVGILPCNSDNDIEKFADLLNVRDVLFKKCKINVGDSCSKKKQSYPNYIPRDSSLYNILKTCVDLRTVPKKVLLCLLSEYTSDDCEKHCLQELCSKEGSSLYNSRILELGTNILDILSVFPSCTPPVDKVLELLPRLMPRPYSIASSPLMTPNELRIVLTVVEEPQEGVCSGWLYKLVKPVISDSLKSVENGLAGLKLQEKKHDIQIPMFFRKSNGFNLPEDSSVPLILIGPGTGIAPFLGFLQHRAAEKEISPSVNFGDVLLFFGCRYSGRDFLFRSDLQQLVKVGVITDIFVSFSREDNWEGSRYVQDNIRKNAQKLVKMVLEEKSIVYVCGDGRKMAKDVWDAFVDVIAIEKGISNSDAGSLLTSMQKEGRYRQDIWL